ncbi:galactosylgalactosylxylosylprotein 3-beta-glucuronosyltransferase 2-like [Haliotis rufescens]|uniref:galactosylgalactosylxylosylprotein 3-beta-glucuronosyltransferase 2-like n=1 Tax=Haliotis rufescens TaxID=6454 RepID=UPI001EB02FA9|nr:galactosylgalactosylxylosylprotein 3-beta-glucuronosyltransferase 2-like [Haliotis rufescens]
MGFAINNGLTCPRRLETVVFPFWFPLYWCLFVLSYFPMRRTRKISVWPVGLVGDQRYEAPIVKNGKVTGWRVSYDPIRKFATDMAGFAMNLHLFFEHPDLQFSHYTRPGSQESDIISKTNITLNDLEPLADNCTKVLVWHTRALPPKLTKEDQMKVKFDHGSNFIVEV